MRDRLHRLKRHLDEIVDHLDMEQGKDFKSSIDLDDIPEVEIDIIKPEVDKYGNENKNKEYAPTEEIETKGKDKPVREDLKSIPDKQIPKEGGTGSEDDMDGEELYDKPNRYSGHQGSDIYDEADDDRDSYRSKPYRDRLMSGNEKSKENKAQGEVYNEADDNRKSPKVPHGTSKVDMPYDESKSERMADKKINNKSDYNIKSVPMHEVSDDELEKLLRETKKKRY